jgi:hypothetical protein
LSDFKLLSYLGLLLPWATFISIPLLFKMRAIPVKKLWKHYYYFMITAIGLALVEYFFVLTGKYLPRMLVIPNGVFLSGKFALFHMLEDGSSHDRFYACFGEPGDLAMFLLPAMAYAFLYKKYFSLIIFLVAFYFTRSLGGMIGLTMLIILLPLFSENKKYKIYSLFLAIIMGIAATVYLSGYFSEQIEEKGGSREVREESISKTITLLPVAIVEYPFGMKLEQTTSGYDKDKLYFGSNFTPGFAFVMGGVVSFLGYCLFLVISLWSGVFAIWRKGLSIEERVVFSSLIVLFPFIFQRGSVWDTALFALLYSPYILKWLDRRFAIEDKFNKQAPHIGT